MKEIMFLGKSLENIKSFPIEARRQAGFELDRIQRRLEPTDWKPMTSIGPGVYEIRVQCRGQFRVIYAAKFADKICVLHAFQKKTQKTSQLDIKMAQNALQIVRELYGYGKKGGYQKI